MFKNSFLTKSFFALKVILTTGGIFFGSQLVASIFIVVLLVVLGNDVSDIDNVIENNFWAATLLSIFVAVLCTSLVWLIVRYRKKDSLQYLGLTRKHVSATLIWSVIKTYTIYFLSLIIIMLLVDSMTPVNVNQQQDLGISDPRTAGEYVQIFVMLVVIPPIFEEILFRGFLYRTLRKRIPIVVAAFITSILFGLAHLEYENLNWVAAIDTLVFSGFLIYLVEKHQSIYGAIALHALKNSIAFLVLFVSP